VIIFNFEVELNKFKFCIICLAFIANSAFIETGQLVKDEVKANEACFPSYHEEHFNYFPDFQQMFGSESLDSMTKKA
jgi:hypothetical protein